MSVYIETSAGDVVVDLFTDECPEACNNFLKLCKNFIAQTGDPQNDGSGGTSVFGLLGGASKRCFSDEIIPELKHNSAGMLGMATGKPNSNASQFYVTLAPDLESLDAKHTLFGEIAEDEDGMIVKLNAAIVDDKERPLQNIRIRRTIVLDDPFPDPDGLEAIVPEQSPEPVYEFGDRLEEDWKPAEDNRTEAEVEADLESQKAQNRKILLEMIGDRPHAEAKAPEEFLFVCKLNPVTTEEDLETIFSRFGEVIACDIIRDKKTGDSLNYAFIGFEEKKSAEEAYLKMNNALIDDRRVKVDFSQSMFHQWKEYRKINIDRGPNPAPAHRPSEGILLSGGKFKLKSGAHGEGVGASLGLMGHSQGHGQSHHRGAEQDEQRHGREKQRKRSTGYGCNVTRGGHFDGPDVKWTNNSNDRYHQNSSEKRDRHRSRQSSLDRDGAWQRSRHRHDDMQENDNRERSRPNPRRHVRDSPSRGL